MVWEILRARPSPVAMSCCTCSSLTGSVISLGRSMPAGASRRPTACWEKYCAPTPGSPAHSSLGAASREATGAKPRADSLLGKVLRADAGIAGPFVDGRVFAVVDGDEGELVEPGGDIALRGDVAGGKRAAEGDAEDSIVVEGHGTGQRGDFAIVDHVEGNAVPGRLEIEKEAADSRVEHVLGDGAIERADADLVGHVDAGGTAADGIDARQMGGGPLQRIVHTVVVILGVALHGGVPGDLVAEDDFAFDDGGALAVAGAQVEADAAAIQVTAERRGGFALLGAGVIGHAVDGHGAAVDAFAHEAVVEGARALRRVDGAQVAGDARFAGNGDAAAAFLPEQVLQKAFGVAMVDGDVVAVVRQDGGAEDGDPTVTALQCDGQRTGAAVLRECAIGAVPERGRQELRVEYGAKFR